jgi:hypothetical protein
MVQFDNEDFWIDEPNYPDDAHGDRRYDERNPMHPYWERMSNWLDLGPSGELLRSEGTKWVWMHPFNEKVWQLSGPGEGSEGVVLGKELDGAMQPDFDIKYATGPYLVGERPQRVDWKKREIHFGAVIQPNANVWRKSRANWWSYRMIEDAWWKSWSTEVPGWLGCWTRTHGWRWIPLILGERTKTVMSTDPVAHGNNTIAWDMVAHGPWPLYAKRKLSRTWKASQDSIDNHNVAHGLLSVANRGTWKKGAWPKYIIKGHGNVTIQDGTGGKMITLPDFFYSDGDYMLVDTDPAAQTIVTEKDPVDNAWWKFMRNSELLNILLSDVHAERGLPAQRRIPGGIEFSNPIPPQEVAHIKVTHDNPFGSVTMLLPQWYEMAYS